MSDDPGTPEDRRRQRKLGRARADLVALPDLVTELAMCLTERTGEPGGGKPGKVIGSPAPLRLDVLHLADRRRKPGWDGDDPRLTNLADRYGVVALLESWTRVVFEEMPEDGRPELAEQASVSSECSVLIEVWDWVSDQRWADELAEDVSRLASEVRKSLGVRPEYRPRCRYCRNVVDPVDRDHRLTSWESCAYGLCRGCLATFPPGPALSALGAVQAPMPLRDLAGMVGVPLKTLHRWADGGFIKPDPMSNGRPKRYDLAQVMETAARMGRSTA